MDQDIMECQKRVMMVEDYKCDAKVKVISVLETIARLMSGD